MIDDIKKEETKIEEEHIKVPEGILEELKELQEEDGGLMNQFTQTAMQFFFIEKRIKEMLNKKENLNSQMQHKFDYLNKKFKLNPKDQARIDFKAGEIIITKHPEVGPAVIIDNKSEVVK